MAQPVPKRRIGPYALDVRLAQGGMGEVYLATEERPSFRRRVIVKLMQAQLAEDPQYRMMFQHEARLGAQLSHGGIAHLYEFGEAAGALYLAMEFVDGPSLSRIVRAVGTAPTALALKVVAEVAAALAYAHALTDEQGRSLNVVHRDVSPQNILVSKSGVVKLIDFGIARSTSQDHHTRTGVLKGKLQYMAPEQFRGRTDRRSDIFALGVVLHELVNGRRLFKRQTEAETLNAIVSDRIPPIDGTDAQRAALQPILDRALARAPEDRYADASDLETDLSRAMQQLGLQCAHADLAALVRRVEKIEAADAPAPGDETSSDSQPSTVARSNLREVGVHDAQTVRTDRGASRTRRRWVWGLAAAVFIAAAAIVAFRTLGHRHTPRTPVAPIRPVPAAAATPTATATGTTATTTATTKGAPSLSRRSSVRVISRPFCDLSVDGRPRGFTPTIPPLELSPGLHRFVCNSDEPVPMRADERVHVEASREVQIIQLHLRPLR